MEASVYIEELLKHTPDPFGAWSDIGYPITKEEVTAFLERNPVVSSLGRTSYMFDWGIDWGLIPKDDPIILEVREEHIHRIAYQVSHGLSGPLDIEFCRGVSIIDGHHRLCAAIIKGQKAIPVNWGGFIDEAPLCFPRSVADSLLVLEEPLTENDKGLSAVVEAYYKSVQQEHSEQYWDGVNTALAQSQKGREEDAKRFLPSPELMCTRFTV